MWKAKNFHDSVFPLRLMYAILAYDVFHYPAEEPHLIFSFIYMIIVTTLYCIALGFTLDFCFKSDWYGENDQTFIQIIYTNVAIAGLAQTLSWYHGTMRSRLFDRISKVDVTLQKLGATFDYTRICNLAIILVFSWIIIIIALNAVDVLWLLDRMTFYQIIIVVYVLHHPIHMNSIVAFNFSMVVRLIGMRFRKANELLEMATPFQQSATNQAWQQSSNKNMRTSSILTSTCQLFNSVQNRKDDIQIIKHVHLELSLISKDLNKTYGVQIALEIGAYLVMITGLFYNLYICFTESSVDRRNVQILVIVVWLCTYFGKLILINQACDSVSAEAQRTVDIIHNIRKSMKDPELLDAVKHFRLQILQQTTQFFIPAGLFTLGFRFVLGFLGTVTTYLVIIVDMSGNFTGG